jgi:hypothetical protein
MKMRSTSPPKVVGDGEASERTPNFNLEIVHSPGLRLSDNPYTVEHDPYAQDMRWVRNGCE